jgi:phosphatidylglycerophosphate synthase
MSESPTTHSTTPSAWIIAHEGAPDLQIWGLTTAERSRRLLGRAGCGVIRVLEADTDPGEASGDSVVIVQAHVILDERLIRGLVAAPNTLLVAPRSADCGGGAIAAHVDAAHAADTLATLRGAAHGETANHPAQLRVAAPHDLASAYTAELRKFDPPFICPARVGNIREIEDHLFRSSYKGSTDLITKWLWPRPAAAVVRRLADAGVKPNSVTAWSWLLAVAAGLLFWKGAFGLGLLCGWLMTFLDTVDGKLARVTLTSTPFGNVMDHSLDLVHPPFWYLAWSLGATGSVNTAATVVIAGYLVGRLLEGLFILSFKIETHCWRPVDAMFRTITARRNPNMLLLSVGVLGGRPDLGLLMVAIWTVVSLVFHSERILQALWERSRGSRIASWDEVPLRGTGTDHTGLDPDTAV